MSLISLLCKRCLLFSLLISQLVALQAQETLELTLEKAIELAQDQSPDAKSLEMEYLASKWDLVAFKASLKPQLSFNADVPGFSRAISNISQDDGSSLFRTQSLAFSSASVFMRQALPFSGGSVFVQSAVSSIWNFEPLDNQLWQTSPLLIGINQPLFQLNQIKWNQREQALAYSVAQIGYLEALESVAQDMTRIFFDAMIAQKDKERAEFNVINNDTIFTLSQGRYEVGKIAENELLQSELRLITAQADFEQAELDYLQALRELRILLNLPEAQPISLILPQQLPDIQIDPELAISRANRYSSFTRVNSLRKFQADRRLREVKQDNRFQADLRATFGLNQSSDDFFDSYRDPVDRQTFSINLDIPLFNWGRGQAERKAAEARRESLMTSLSQDQRDFENNVFFQVKSLQQLEKRLQIAARSDTVAQRRYDISKKRYLIGKISIQDLFIAQQEKDAAQQNYVNSLRSFWNAWAELRRLTLYDFEEQEPILDQMSDQF